MRRFSRDSDSDEYSDEFEEMEMMPTVVPTDTKWGWFVVFCSFICNMIVDGLQYTFANVLMPIALTMESSVTEVALICSLLSGFYNFSGPIGGALGNKFGFRMVVIVGSLMSSGGLMISYFAMNIPYLYFFYGVLGGLGFGMIYMSTVITTSMYFEKYRALAASISVCGTGVGTFVFTPVGHQLVTNYGWRLTLIIEGVIVLLCILCGWTFRPLKTITVVPVSKKPSPMSMTTIDAYARSSMYTSGEQRKTMPNEAYPTFKEALMMQDEKRSVGIPHGAKSPRTMNIESEGTIMTSRLFPIYSLIRSLDRITPAGKETHKTKCRNFCYNFWHCQRKHRNLNLGDRPMYRDDIFYGGSLNALRAYSSTGRTNYHLSVTRVPGARELEEHERRTCCVCHQAFIRACITMMGCNLLKSKVFAFFCISSFMYTMALYVPYVFINKMAVQEEIPPDTAIWLVSAMGISNTFGRLVSGVVKSLIKVNAALLALICLFISGASAFIFFFCNNLACFFSFTCIFGFFSAPFMSLRPVIIVEFLGLEKLTNAFGLMLLTQGVASILGPPVAGMIEENTGNSANAIYMAGGLLTAASLTLLLSTLLSLRAQRLSEKKPKPIKSVLKKQKKKNLPKDKVEQAAPEKKKKNAPKGKPQQAAPDKSKMDAPKGKPQQAAPDKSKMDAPKGKPEQAAPDKNKMDTPKGKPEQAAPDKNKMDTPKGKPE